MSERRTDRTIDRPWHRLTTAATVRELATDPVRGLDEAEVERRRAAHGPNLIVERARRGLARMMLDQLADVMVVMLLAAAVVAGFVGEPQDTVAIAAIVVLNAVLGFVQEYRAERAMSALKALAAPQARVRRAGTLTIVAAADLVPGDVVLLEAGNAVPADLRLLESAELRIDESALTGESHPAERSRRRSTSAATRSGIGATSRTRARS